MLTLLGHVQEADELVKVTQTKEVFNDLVAIDSIVDLSQSSKTSTERVVSGAAAVGPVSSCTPTNQNATGSTFKILNTREGPSQVNLLERSRSKEI